MKIREIQIGKVSIPLKASPVGVTAAGVSFCRNRLNLPDARGLGVSGIVGWQRVG